MFPLYLGLGDRRRTARHRSSRCCAAPCCSAPSPASRSAPSGTRPSGAGPTLVADPVVGQRHPRRGHAHGDRRRRGRRPARRPARRRAAPPPAAARPSRGPPSSAAWSCSPACATNGLLATVPSRRRGHVRDRDVQERPADGEHHRPAATRPTSLDDPAWVQITSWQGHGLVVDALERTGEGEYRTTQPIPHPRRLEGAAARARRPDAHAPSRSTCPPTRPSRPRRSPPTTA